MTEFIQRKYTVRAKDAKSKDLFYLYGRQAEVT